MVNLTLGLIVTGGPCPSLRRAIFFVPDRDRMMSLDLDLELLCEKAHSRVCHRRRPLIGPLEMPSARAALLTSFRECTTCSLGLLAVEGYYGEQEERRMVVGLLETPAMSNSGIPTRTPTKGGDQFLHLLR